MARSVPGAEASWIMRNPAIYAQAYRIRHATPTSGELSQPAKLPGGSPQTAVDLQSGLEPGDITKYIDFAKRPLIPLAALLVATSASLQSEIILSDE